MVGQLLPKRKQDDDREVIIVSGLPRSGTSLMMMMLEAGGLQLLRDNLREADEDNPRGYHEFDRVINLAEGDKDWVESARGKVVKVISSLLQNLPDDYEYYVIFMNRNLSEVLASQKKMLARRGEEGEPIEDSVFIDLFRKHLVETKKWMESKDNFQYIEISYNELVESPTGLCDNLATYLERNLDIDAMINQIDYKLYRNRT